MLDIKLPFRILQWVDHHRGDMPRSVFIKKCLIYLYDKDDSLDVDKIKDL